MRKSILCLALALLFSAMQANAQVNILGGVPGGTYDKMIRELDKALGKVQREGKTLSLNNVTLSDSKGSFYNYVHLKNSENHLALMQFDVLQYQRGLDLDAGTEDANHYKVVMPFGEEEIHIFMNRASDPHNLVHNLDDLRQLIEASEEPEKAAEDSKPEDKGKTARKKRKRIRVAMGSNMQGTYITASNLKQKLELNWTEAKMGFNHSWRELINGKIDVLIFVGSAPVEALRKISPEVKDKIKMIGIASNPELDKIYTPAIISSNRYSWLDEDVQTYAVPTVLVSYDKNESESHTQLISNFLDVLHEQLPAIQEDQFTYHPAWQKVNMLYELDSPDAFLAAYPYIPLWMYHKTTFDFVKRNRK